MQPLPTILVVEDVEEVRTVTRLILSQEKFNVLEAADGQQALHEIEARKGAVDLVLTDVLMPVMTGTEMADRLSKVHPSLRILFMSGYNHAPWLRILQEHESLFVPKPFTAATLISSVKKALAQPWTGLPRLA